MTADWKESLARLRAEADLPEGDEPAAEAQAEPEAGASKWPRQKLNVVKERKGRGGKTATIVEGFTLPDEEVERIAAILKKKLGCGGSARGGEILIQGDCVDKVRALLREIL